MKELKAFVDKEINRHPYIQTEIEKIYNQHLDEIKKGRNVTKAIEMCKDEIKKFIYR